MVARLGRCVILLLLLLEDRGAVAVVVSLDDLYGLLGDGLELVNAGGASMAGDCAAEAVATSAAAVESAI